MKTSREIALAALSEVNSVLAEDNAGPQLKLSAILRIVECAKRQISEVKE
jgi:hypothetical protein